MRNVMAMMALGLGAMFMTSCSEGPEAAAKKITEQAVEAMKSVASLSGQDLPDDMKVEDISTQLMEETDSTATVKVTVKTADGKEEASDMKLVKKDGKWVSNLGLGF